MFPPSQTHTQAQCDLAFSAFSSCCQINPPRASVCCKPLAASLLSACLCTLGSPQCRLCFKGFWETSITNKLMLSFLLLWRWLEYYHPTVFSHSPMQAAELKTLSSFDAIVHIKSPPGVLIPAISGSRVSVGFGQCYVKCFWILLHQVSQNKIFRRCYSEGQKLFKVFSQAYASCLIWSHYRPFYSLLGLVVKPWCLLSHSSSKLPPKLTFFAQHVSTHFRSQPIRIALESEPTMLYN